VETILALIPVYQEPRIATVVEGATACLPVAVVDDGSTDKTAALAEAAGGRRPTPDPACAQGGGGRLAALRTLDQKHRTGHESPSTALNS
jgi:glycosyltransferase involved in cell wall biosynthesis